MTYETKHEKVEALEYNSNVPLKELFEFLEWHRWDKILGVAAGNNWFYQKKHGLEIWIDRKYQQPKEGQFIVKKKGCTGNEYSLMYHTDFCNVYDEKTREVTPYDLFQIYDKLDQITNGCMAKARGESWGKIYGITCEKKGNTFVLDKILTP